jgi:2-oxoglutarate ferredoxin oxidoreductase subunit beta
MPEATVATPTPLAEFKSKVSPDWCPGCGDYGVLSALQKAVSSVLLRCFRHSRM